MIQNFPTTGFWWRVMTFTKFKNILNTLIENQNEALNILDISKKNTLGYSTTPP
jgi:hypothetical protein